MGSQSQNVCVVVLGIYNMRLVGMMSTAHLLPELATRLHVDTVHVTVDLCVHAHVHNKCMCVYTQSWFVCTEST